MYSFHLIPIYNRAQFVDKTDPCCSTSGRQGRVRTGAAMERYQDITPETPSLASASAAHTCLCSPWECRARGIPHCLCCQTGIRQIESESASLVRAVKDRPQGNPTPGLWRALSLSAMVLCSVQMGKRGQKNLIHPATRECATDIAGGLPIPLCPYCR